MTQRRLPPPPPSRHYPRRESSLSRIQRMADAYEPREPEEPEVDWDPGPFDPEAHRPIHAQPHHFLVNQRAAGMSPRDFDRDALRRGTAHEMEHTQDRRVAERIAMDHLAEREDYCDRIEACMPEHEPNSDYDPSAVERKLHFLEDLAYLAQATPEGSKAWNDDDFPTLVRLGVLRDGQVSAVKSAHAYLERHYDQWMEEQGDEQARMQAYAEMGYENNPSSCYVWVLDDGDRPLEGPYGPFSKDTAKQYARIAAKQGRHDRAVTMGQSLDGEIVRIYEGGTGKKLVANSTVSSGASASRKKWDPEDLQDAEDKQFQLRFLPYLEADEIIGYTPRWAKRGYGYGRWEEFFSTLAEARERMQFLIDSKAIEDAEILERLKGGKMVRTVDEWRDDTPATED